jgi:hypothetical protein
MISCTFGDDNMRLSGIHKIILFRFFIFINIFHIFPSVLANSSTEINLQGQIPRVEFDSTRYDFGDIYRGQRLIHQYKFINTGNGTLVFSNIHAACGCMNTKIYAEDKKTIKNIFKPGERGVVNVEFNSQDFSGAIIRTITLETNMGSSSPTVTLTISANVLQEISASPALLYVGKIHGETNKSFTINMNFFERAKKFNNQAESINYIQSEIANSKIADSYKDSILSNTESLKILAVESSVPYLKVKLVPTVLAQPPQILVQFDEKQLPIGSINAKIKVWNNSTYYKNYEIPVVGESVGHVQVSAKYVEFGVVNSARSAERVISFKSKNKNFLVTGVKVDLKKLPELQGIKDTDFFEVKREKSVHSEAISDSTITSFLVSFKLFYPKKLNQAYASMQKANGLNVSGFFIVKTNDPDYKEISVPFFGVLRADP